MDVPLRYKIVETVHIPSYIHTRMYQSSTKHHTPVQKYTQVHFIDVCHHPSVSLSLCRQEGVPLRYILVINYIVKLFVEGLYLSGTFH